jgi:proline iminopeptidase
MKKALLILFAVLLLQQNANCQVADSIVLPNAVLYYYTYGKGETLILLSGGPGGSGHHMDHMIGELDKQYQIILFDQRGTGRSWTKPFDSTTINVDQAIEDLETLRKKLGLSKMNLLGRSWGSMLAAGYIAKYPQRVRLFISVCGGNLDLSLESTIRAHARVMSKDPDSSRYRYWTNPMIVKQDSAKAAFERTRLHLQTRVFDSAKIDAVYERQTRQGPGNSKMAAEMWKTFPARLRFTKAGHHFKGKTLLVFGWHDPISLTTISQYMQAFPCAEIQGIFRAGHFPETEEPEQFYPVVNAFLQRNIRRK